PTEQNENSKYPDGIHSFVNKIKNKRNENTQNLSGICEIRNREKFGRQDTGHQPGNWSDEGLIFHLNWLVTERYKKTPSNRRRFLLYRRFIFFLLRNDYSRIIIRIYTSKRRTVFHVDGIDEIIRHHGISFCGQVNGIQ